MAKNYANIYNQAGDSISLEQRFYIKEESARGTLAVPTDSDFMFTLSGGSVNKTQPIESSPYRSGRSNTGVIPQKIETTWTIPAYFNIDTTLGTAGTDEIDQAFRTLWKSALGIEDVTGGSPVYRVGVPDINFSIFEVGDMWSKQASGAYVESASASFPGDGQSQVDFAGNAKNALLIGIGKAVAGDYNGGNTITVQSGEGARFKVGGLVMLVEADGLTRSADTPNGSPRIVTDVTGDIVTLNGAVLADADATAADIYLSYYEPEAPTAINDPAIGLEGSVTIVNIPGLDCVRSASINLTNNHEILNFCFGKKVLEDGSFAAGGRADVEVTLELNLNHDLIQFINGLDEFAGEDITLVLGNSAGRHLQIEIPKVIFPIPEISVPESGSIPVTFTALANQTALGAGDEITYTFQ